MQQGDRHIRREFRDYNLVRIELEDLDVTVQLVHTRSLATVTVGFRLDPSAPDTRTRDLKRRLGRMTPDILVNLTASLEKAGAPGP